MAWNPKAYISCFPFSWLIGGLIWVREKHFSINLGPSKGNIDSMLWGWLLRVSCKHTMGHTYRLSHGFVGLKLNSLSSYWILNDDTRHLGNAVLSFCCTLTSTYTPFSYRSYHCVAIVHCYVSAWLWTSQGTQAAVRIGSSAGGAQSHKARNWSSSWEK
jgi:hypothetical protein